MKTDWKIWLLSLLMVGVAGWQVLNWWNRPPAVEYDNLKYVQLLTTAVSTQNRDHLNKVEFAIQKRFDEQQMSPSELEHFEEIIALARNDEWEQAHRACAEFAEAQLGRRRGLRTSTSEGHSHQHGHAH